MAKQQKIKYIIKQDGTVEEQVEGVGGDTCTTLTSEIEKRLGDLENQVYTADYYQPITTEDVTLQHNQNQD